MADIRIKLNYFDHPKIIKLERLLGPAGVLAHQRILCFAAENKPKGELDGMDRDDIAIAAKWQGETDELIDTLVSLKLLDINGSGFHKIHDWKEHNPFAFYGPERSERARKAAEARWDARTKSKPKNADGTENDADSIESGANGMPDAMLKQQSSNAPSPSPTPTPNPAPSPNPFPNPAPVSKPTNRQPENLIKFNKWVKENTAKMIDIAKNLSNITNSEYPGYSMPNWLDVLVRAEVQKIRAWLAADSQRWLNEDDYSDRWFRWMIKAKDDYKNKTS